MSFVDAVRQGKLKQPTQIGFVSQDWSSSYVKYNDGTENDDNLHVAGLYFFDKFELIRHELDALDLSEFDRDSLCQAFCALLNYEFVQIRRISIESEDNPVIADEWIQRILPNNIPGTLLTSEEAVTVIVDSAKHSIRYAMDQNNMRNHRLNNADFAQTLFRIRKASALAQVYDSLENLWAELTWNNWCIDMNLNPKRLRPRRAEEELARVISDFRRQKLEFESLGFDMNAWSHRLSNEVKQFFLAGVSKLTIKGSGKSKQITLSEQDPVASSPPLTWLQLNQAQGLYYQPILDVAFPNLDFINIKRLLRIWESIASLASEVCNRCDSLAVPKSMNALFQYAPKFSRRQLAKAIAESQELTLPQANSVLKFLTYGGKRREELWTRPIVPIGSDEFLIPLAALMAPNLLRCSEKWMKEGGISLNERGPEFESHVRDNLSHVLRTSSALTRTYVCPTAIEISSLDVDEEIDVCLLVGDILVVGEVKCQLFPCDPLEMHNYLDTLDDAAQQAKRKAEHVAVNIVEVEAAFRVVFPAISFEVRRVVPTVITNTPIGVGFPKMGVGIIDMTALTSYLDNHGMKLRAQYNDEGVLKYEQELKYYDTEAEAVNGLEAFLLCPPQVSRHFPFVGKRDGVLLAVSADDEPLAITGLRVEFVST